MLFALLVAGCDDFLDVAPKGKVIPSEVKDYDLLLNGGSITIHTTSDEDLLFLSADDYYSDENKLGDLNDQSNRFLKAYRWDKELFPDMVKVKMWNKSYNSIYTYNLIVEEVETANLTSGYYLEDVKRIKAEAQAVRAYEYWLLVNSFAKQYDAITAVTDAGVPMVTKADASGATNGRASVKEIYDFIIADLNQSLESLPNVPENKVRPTKATAHALLARVYLQMNDYTKARENATKALDLNNTIGDYVTTSRAAFTKNHESEQYMYRYYGYTRGFTKGYATDDLIALFDKDNDKRLKWMLREYGYWKKNEDGSYFKDENNKFVYVSTGQYTNYTARNISHCVTIPEMYVIRAECNARLSDGTIQNVVDDMNTLRRMRIASYTDLTSADLSTKKEALKFALDERRREMMMSGMRWFDLKRLNKEPEHAVTITHPLKETNEVFTLAPNSNNYVFPIPVDVLNFNADMEQNIRD